jgi:hypothetical protein
VGEAAGRSSSQQGMKKRHRESDKADREAWDHRANSPFAWLDRADVLRECADMVGRRFVSGLAPVTKPTTTEGVSPLALGPVYQMLAGYSLESLLKGIIVARRPDVIQKQRLRKDFVTHNFDKLLDLAGLDLDELGVQFLRRLGDAVVWIGKYPVSTSADQMQRVTLSSGRDVLMFRHLYDLFYKTLLTVMPKQSPRP